MATREPIPARIGRALARSWAKLGWKGKTLLCGVAYLALNLAVIVYGSHKPAKPNTVSESKTVAEQTAKASPSNSAPSEARPAESPRTVVSLPAKKTAPTLLPAIRDFILDEYHRYPAIGDVGCLDCPCVRIENIIDDRCCIVRICSYGEGFPATGMVVQLKGWPTAGKVTGQKEDVVQTFFRVTGTSSHKTIGGGSVTMHDMEVVKPLVGGDIVRLPFASGIVSRTVDKNSCVVHPLGQDKNSYDGEFVPILVKGWSIREKKKVPGSNAVSRGRHSQDDIRLSLRPRSCRAAGSAGQAGSGGQT